jgi:hypothetical protein
MDQIDVEKFRVKAAPTPMAEERKGLPRHKKGERFLAGPIPWNWWAKAAQLPGKPLHVASAIWFLAFMKKTETFQLQGSVLRDLGVSRKSAYRVLKAMEEAGLISCNRGPGRRPIITVLDQSEKLNGNGKESSMTGENG